MEQWTACQVYGVKDAALWVGPETALNRDYLKLNRVTVVVAAAPGIDVSHLPFKSKLGAGENPGIHHGEWGLTVLVQCPFADANLPSEAMLEGVACMVAEMVRCGHRALIVCHAGLNRSALITARVLCNLGASRQMAVSLLRTHRSEWCLSNQEFEQYVLNA